MSSKQEFLRRWNFTSLSILAWRLRAHFLAGRIALGELGAALGNGTREATLLNDT
jgi:hypothetical protein